MSTFTALGGQCRIYDSSDIRRSLLEGNVQNYEDTVPTWTDITSEAHGVGVTGDLFAAADDLVYVGHEEAFARIDVELDTAAVAAGTLTVEYYNGTAWAAVQSLLDGSHNGVTTFGQDGVISFKPAADWALQGAAELDSDKFYVRLGTSLVPSTAPDCEVIYPVDGQYVDVLFDSGDFSAPEGHARPEEMLILHRGRHGEHTHYVLGSDDPVVEPVDVSFSFRLGDVPALNEVVTQALQCGSPAVATWAAAGVSTLGDTARLSGCGDSVATPAQVDPEKAGVSILLLWRTCSGNVIGRAYHGVYVSPDNIAYSEADDGVTVSVTGQCFGAIQAIYHFAQQF